MSVNRTTNRTTFLPVDIPMDVRIPEHTEENRGDRIYEKRKSGCMFFHQAYRLLFAFGDLRPKQKDVGVLIHKSTTGCMSKIKKQLLLL